MKAYLGLMIVMGILRLPTIAMYWATAGVLSLKKFPDVMGRNRFEAIKRYFHISDNEQLPARNDQNYDCLQKVSAIFNLVLPRFKREYNLRKNVNIDEAMIPFKGHLSIKQYIKAKPHTWGIKSWALAESATGHIYTLQIYKGKARESACRNWFCR
jgi:hypothetical protein